MSDQRAMEADGPPEDPPAREEHEQPEEQPDRQAARQEGEERAGGEAPAADADAAAEQPAAKKPRKQAAPRKLKSGPKPGKEGKPAKAAGKPAKAGKPEKPVKPAKPAKLAKPAKPGKAGPKLPKAGKLPKASKKKILAAAGVPVRRLEAELRGGAVEYSCFTRSSARTLAMRAQAHRVNKDVTETGRQARLSLPAATGRNLILTPRPARGSQAMKEFCLRLASKVVPITLGAMRKKITPTDMRMACAYVGELVHGQP